MHGAGRTEQPCRPYAVPGLQGGTGEAGDRVRGEQVVAPPDRFAEGGAVVPGGFLGAAGERGDPAQSAQGLQAGQARVLAAADRDQRLSVARRRAPVPCSTRRSRDTYPCRALAASAPGCPRTAPRSRPTRNVRRQAASALSADVPSVGAAGRTRAAEPTRPSGPGSRSAPSRCRSDRSR
ncbi:hypothetical protein ACFQZ4_07310 [Catellatospora coxensis]